MLRIYFIFFYFFHGYASFGLSNRLLGLLFYLVLISPMPSRFFRNLHEKRFNVSVRLVTIIGVVGTLFWQYTFHQARPPMATYHVRPIELFLFSLFSILFNSLLIFVVSLFPWRRLFTSEAWSEFLEFIYGGLKLVLYALVAVEVLCVLAGVLASVADIGEIFGIVFVFTTLYIPGMLFPLLVLHPTVVRIRQRRVMRVLMHVRRALNARLPLVHVLQSAARSEYGKLSQRLESVAVQIEQGLSISDALAMSVPEIPRQQIRLLQASDRIGYLPQALERYLDEQMVNQTNRMTHGGPGWRYLILNFFVGSFLLSALMIFIVPKFEKIFEDFGTELPPMTQSVMNLSRWLGGSLPGQVFPGSIMLIPILATVLVLWYARNRDGILGACSQFVGWYLPGFRSVHRPGQWAKAAHQIADGLAVSLPLHQAVSLAHESLSHAILKPKLKRFLFFLNHGEDAVRAARFAGLPKTFTTMLNSSTQQYSPQSLRYLAEYYTVLAQQRLVWFSAMTAPVTIMLIAFPVGWICIGMFSPLVHLIQHCAEFTGMY